MSRPMGSKNKMVKENTNYSLCLCGCGYHVARPQNTYIIGHNGRDKHRSPETRLKIGIKHRGKPTWSKGKKLSKEHVKKVQLANIGQKRLPEAIQKMRESTLSLWENPEYREKNIQSHLGQTRTPEASEKARKAMLQLWSNPEWAINQIKAMAKGKHHLRPNCSEILLQEILNKYFPKIWKFVGNGKLVIGRKNPDFINIFTRNHLIELYGTYWHRNDNPQDMINYYREYEYKCLVIWENELDKTNLILDKITKFVEGKERPIVDGETGKRVLELALMAKESGGV